MIRQLLTSPAFSLIFPCGPHVLILCGKGWQTTPLGQTWPSQIRPQAKNDFYVSERLHTKLYQNQHKVFNFASWAAKPKIVTVWPYIRKVDCPLLHIIVIRFAMQYHQINHIVTLHHVFSQAIPAT